MDAKKIGIKKRGDDCDYITYNQRHPKNDTCIAFYINLPSKLSLKSLYHRENKTGKIGDRFMLY